MQRQYRDQIVKGLEWVKREGAQQLNSIQFDARKRVYQLEEDLNTDSVTITALQSEGGFLDQYKNYISSIVDVFKISGEIKDIDNS